MIERVRRRITKGQSGDDHRPSTSTARPGPAVSLIQGLLHNCYRTDCLACSKCPKTRCQICGFESALCLFIGTDSQYGETCLFCRMESAIRFYYARNEPWRSDEASIRSCRAQAGLFVTEWQMQMKKCHAKAYNSKHYMQCSSATL